MPRRNDGLLIWQPATARQMATMKKFEVDAAALEAVVDYLPPDPADIAALSKQEACFLISVGAGSPMEEVPRPISLGYALERGEDAETLPGFGKMVCIRDSLRRLGWKRDRYRPWLWEKFKTAELRDLDHATAHKVDFALAQMLKRRN